MGELLVDNKSRRFRVRLMGGFDRRDVSDYLKTVLREKDAIENELKALKNFQGLSHIERPDATDDALSTADAKRVSEQIRRDSDLRVTEMHILTEQRIREITDEFQKRLAKETTDIIAAKDAEIASLKDELNVTEASVGTLTERLNTIEMRYRELMEKFNEVTLAFSNDL